LLEAFLRPPSSGPRTAKLPKPTSRYCVIPFLLPPPKDPCPKGQEASQGGRRRFDPGRALSWVRTLDATVGFRGPPPVAVWWQFDRGWTCGSADDTTRDGAPVPAAPLHLGTPHRVHGHPRLLRTRTCRSQWSM